MTLRIFFSLFIYQTIVGLSLDKANAQTDRRFLFIDTSPHLVKGPFIAAIHCSPQHGVVGEMDIFPVRASIIVSADE